MIIAYTKAPVIEEILVDEIQEYLKTVGWNDLYPNFPIRVNNEYPWVPYMGAEEYFENGWLDLGKVQDTLFPSVTVVTSQDSKSPEIFAKVRETTLENTDLPEFEVQAAEDGYMISPEGLKAIRTHFATYDELYGVNIVYQRRDTVNIDITVDDQTNIKNRIYDFLYLYFIGHGNTKIKRERDIQIIEGSVDGSRSGTYNVDFGRVLRGATIQMQVDYKISQVYYDTSASAITSVEIDHTTEAGE